MIKRRHRIATAGIVGATVALSGHQVRSGGVVQHDPPSVQPLHPDVFVPRDASPEVSRSAPLVAAPPGPDASTMATARTDSEPVRAAGPVVQEVTAYCLNGVMADGEHVHSGAAASDLYPLGTHLEVSGFGEVTIEDRTAPGATDVDLWMASCWQARQWGRRWIDIERLAA